MMKKINLKTYNKDSSENKINDDSQGIKKNQINQEEKSKKKKEKE